jgi:hypothetical protein
VPRETAGAEKENRIMNQNQVSQFAPLDQAAGAGGTAVMDPSAGGNDSGTGPSDQKPSRRYLPVYHVQLVRDRSISIADRPTIRNSEDVVAILRDELLQADRERLVCLFLNAKNVVTGMEVVSIGTLTSSPVTPREVFKAAILASAAAIIICHNHISGNPAPSVDDVQVTERISKAGELLGIKLLDHIIIAELGTYSFSNAGRMP